MVEGPNINASPKHNTEKTFIHKLKKPGCPIGQVEKKFWSHYMLTLESLLAPVGKRISVSVKS